MDLASKDLDRRKAFALEALKRLRRDGYVDEHNMPVLPGSSAPCESLSREEPTSLPEKFSPPRQGHNSTELLEAVKVHKHALLNKFREVDLKNPKANHKAG